MSQKYVKAGTEGQFEDEVMERHRSGGSLMSRSDDERYFRQVKTKPVRLYTPPINPERLWNPSMNAMEYVEEGTHGQFEDEVMERHRSGGTFSSEEVSSMTSDQFISVMKHAGDMQRRGPERYAKMGQSVHAPTVHGTSWGDALESVGDVTHRMTADGMGGPATSVPHSSNTDPLWSPPGKINLAVDHLNLLRHRQQGFTEWDSDEAREWGTSYSKSFSRNVPVYTRPQELAKNSAVHLGLKQFNQSIANMDALHGMAKSAWKRNAPVVHEETDDSPMPLEVWEDEITFGSPPQEQDPDTGEWRSRLPTDEELANPTVMAGEPGWTEYPKHQDTEYHQLMRQQGSVEFLRSQGR